MKRFNMDNIAFTLTGFKGETGDLFKFIVGMASSHFAQLKCKKEIRQLSFFLLSFLFENCQFAWFKTITFGVNVRITVVNMQLSSKELRRLREHAINFGESHPMCERSLAAKRKKILVGLIINSGPYKSTLIAAHRRLLRCAGGYSGATC